MIVWLTGPDPRLLHALACRLRLKHNVPVFILFSIGAMGDSTDERLIEPGGYCGCEPKGVDGQCPEDLWARMTGTRDGEKVKNILSLYIPAEHTDNPPLARENHKFFWRITRDYLVHNTSFREVECKDIRFWDTMRLISSCIESMFEPRIQDQSLLSA